MYFSTPSIGTENIFVYFLGGGAALCPNGAATSSQDTPCQMNDRVEGISLCFFVSSSKRSTYQDYDSITHNVSVRLRLPRRRLQRRGVYPSGCIFLLCASPPPPPAPHPSDLECVKKETAINIGGRGRLCSSTPLSQLHSLLPPTTPSYASFESAGCTAVLSDQRKSGTTAGHHSAAKVSGIAVGGRRSNLLPVLLHRSYGHFSTYRGSS